MTACSLPRDAMLCPRVVVNATGDVAGEGQPHVAVKDSHIIYKKCKVNGGHIGRHLEFKVDERVYDFHNGNTISFWC